jgi:magnesium transporter
MFNVNLNQFHLRDIENEIHPSIFIKNEEYDVLIMRLPFKSQKDFKNESHAFVVTETSYYSYDKTKKEFIDLKDIHGLYAILNEKINVAMSMTYALYNKIERIEDGFYEHHYIKRFNHQWFYYKNSLIKINRVISKAMEALKSFIKDYKIEDDFLEINFKDLLEHLERTSRTAAHSLEKLDALYNFYVSINNEKMNRTIYVLTLLSGIFLPLNLIVGFFGMNTTSLPFASELGGTHIVMWILFSVIVVSFGIIIYAKKMKIKD